MTTDQTDLSARTAAVIAREPLFAERPELAAPFAAMIAAFPSLPVLTEEEAERAVAESFARHEAAYAAWKAQQKTTD